MPKTQSQVQGVQGAVPAESTEEPTQAPTDRVEPVAQPTDATQSAGADITADLAKTPSWGQAGSFVFDPVTGQRVPEQDLPTHKE